jgi:hypothetical protein
VRPPGLLVRRFSAPRPSVDAGSSSCARPRRRRSRPEPRRSVGGAPRLRPSRSPIARCARTDGSDGSPTRRSHALSAPPTRAMMIAGTSQYRPPPPTIRVTPAISVNREVARFRLVRSSVRAKRDSGPASMSTRPRPTRIKAAPAMTPRTISSVPRAQSGCRGVTTRIEATSGIVKSTSVRDATTCSAGCFAIRLVFTEIATNRSPINAPLAAPTTTPKLSHVSTTRRLSGCGRASTACSLHPQRALGPGWVPALPIHCRKSRRRCHRGSPPAARFATQVDPWPYPPSGLVPPRAGCDQDTGLLTESHACAR